MDDSGFCYKRMLVCLFVSLDGSEITLSPACLDHY